MRIQKKLLMGVLLFVLTVAFCVPMQGGKVYAASLQTQAQADAFVKTLKFIDSGTIRGTLGNETITFKTSACPGSLTSSGCFSAADLVCSQDKAYISKKTGAATFNTPADPSSAGYYLNYRILSAGSCNAATAIKTGLPINAAASNVLASRLNAETIIARSGIGGIAAGEKFVKIGAASSNVYGRDKESGDKCQDFIRVVGTKATVFEIKESTSGHSLRDAGVDQRNDCEILTINGSSNFNTDAEARRLAQAANGFTLGTVTQEELDAENNDDGGAAEQEDKCVGTESGPLGWILCPIIDLAGSFSGFVFQKFIIPFLEDVPISTEDGDGAYEAWKQFRLIGNIVLVGTMLAVVYAQVRGDR